MSAAEPTIRRVQRVNVHNEIVERLIEFILSQGLRRGDKLPTERDLTQMMGVGRSSLREATRSLAAMGIIQIQPRGMVVGGGESAVLSTPIAWGLLLSAHSAREVIEARSVVEISLAETAAERATAEELALVEDALRRMHETVNQPDDFVVHDLAFHLAVAQAGHNVMLLHVVRTIQLVIRAWIEKVIREYEHIPVSYDEHRLVYEALIEQDPGKARAAMAAHLAAAGTRLLKTVPDSDTAYLVEGDGLGSGLDVILPGLTND